VKSVSQRQHGGEVFVPASLPLFGHMPRLAPLGLELGADHVEIDVLRAGDIDTPAYRSVNSGLVFGYRERELARGR
jgi:hypothetical protein